MNQKKETSTLEKLIEDLKGLFLADVFKIMSEGKFTSINNHDAIPEGATVIGEMSPFEKALATYVDTLVIRNNEIIAIAKNDGKDLPEDDFRKLSEESKRNYTNSELAAGLLWDSIRTRFKDEKSSKALFADFRIVSMNDADTDCTGCGGHDDVHSFNNGGVKMRIIRVSSMGDLSNIFKI